MRRTASQLLSPIDRWVGHVEAREDRHRARFVTGVVALMLPFVSAVLVAHLIYGVWFTQLALGILLVALLGVLGLVRAGHSQGAAALFVTVLSLIGNAAAALTGGPQSGGFAMNTLVLVFAAVTLPRWVLGVLVLVATAAGAASVSGVIPVAWQVDPVFHLVPWTIILVVVAIVSGGLVWLWQSAYQELEETMLSRDQLSRILDGLAEQVWVTDTNRRVVTVNEAVLRAGWSHRRLGIRIDEVIEGAATLEESGRAMVRRPDGSRFAAMVSRRRVDDQEVWAATDVTALEQTAEALRAAHRQATAANQAKSRFLATMSHELRTPLNAIIGYGELLQEAEQDTAARQDLERIATAANALLSLINGVLDLSRIEAGQDALELVDVPLQAILDPVVAMIRPLATGKQLALELEHPDGSLVVHTDPDRLRQVLLNLLANAIKFTDAGRVALAVETWERAGLPWLRFTVDDTGSGIGAEDLASIFEPFVQAESGRQRGGTGLGLAICRSFVEMLGGQIYVESTPDQGSRFVVEVPNGRFEALTPGREQRIG